MQTSDVTASVSNYPCKLNKTFKIKQMSQVTKQETECEFKKGAYLSPVVREERRCRLWPSVCPSDCPTDVESVRLSGCRVFIDALLP